MPLPKFITIDGKRFAWRDVLQRRREQIAACAEPEQPTLFGLKEDRRLNSSPAGAARFAPRETMNS